MRVRNTNYSESNNQWDENKIMFLSSMSRIKL